MNTRGTISVYMCWFLSVISLAYVCTLSTQPSSIRFQHLTVNDGLSHNSVYAILQDSQGFMWFGTYVGLTRYDGYSMKVYKHDPEDPHSLSHNAVIALYEDADGNLWIGTNEGLNRYDRKLDRFVRYLHNPEDPHSLSHNKINMFGRIYEDRRKNLWISTELGVDMLEKESGQFIHMQANPLVPEELRDDLIYQLYEDTQGMFWLYANEVGLYRFDPQARQLFFHAHDPDDPTTLSNGAIQGFFEDRHGNLWIGTWDGVNRFARETGEFVRYVHDPDSPVSLNGTLVMGMAEDFSGRLWIGTADGGLNVFRPETGDFVRYQNNPTDPQSLNDDRVRSLYYAPSGVLWIGTKTGGVNAVPRGVDRFLHYRADPENPESLSQNVVYPIYEDRDGILWLGTRGGGLNRFDRERGMFTHYRHDPNDPFSVSSDDILSIYEDRAGNLWIGTDGHYLNRFDRETEQFFQYPFDLDPADLGPRDESRRYHAFYEDDAGRFWIATVQGLWLLDRETGVRQIFEHLPDDPASLSDTHVRTLYEDRAGTFWVGTAGGLNAFNRDTGQAIRYMHDADNENSLSNDTVICIHEDRSGRLWIGTDRGLNLFDRATGMFTPYREKDGLPNDHIYGILEDSAGNLWMSTNMGLTKFSPDDGTFTNYDERDGLQGNEFNTNSYCQTHDGLMLFGGFNGFNTFYPEQVQDNPYIPPVVLTDFQLFQKPVAIGENSVLQQTIENTRDLTLSYRDFIFSFEFAALNYIAPEKNRYRYIMEGFETAWNETDSSRRFVTYTNLNAGHYIFRVHGSNNDGVWNEEGVALTVTITPPWWERWGFRAFVGLALIVMLFATYQVRIQALRYRHKELEQQVNTRTRELREEIETRKHTEEALRESEERFRSIVETTPGMLSITDAKGTTLYMSPNCERLLGCTQAEMMNSFRWWIHEDDLPGARKIFERAFTEGQPGRNFEYKAVRKNGDIWYASSSWEPIYDATGVFVGVVMQTLDITERKQAEQELHRLYEQTRQDADIKAELLREVNHRVGNNLTAIAGMLSLERRHLEQQHQTAYHGLMQDLTNRVNGLARVHDMLSASEWSPLPIGELIRRVVHSSLQILPLDTYVKVDVTASPLRVNADQAHHLALILNELATNTAKYAIHQRERARIVVDATKDDGMMQIRFQDDGPGYPDEVLHMRKQNVGLNLVQQLMQRNLQGEWTMQNEEGAVTILRFPLEEQDESA